MHSFEIRDSTEADMKLQAEYFHSASDEYLYNLGVEVKKIREKSLFDPEEARKKLQIPVAERTAHSYAIVINQRTVGLAIVKKIKFGEEADLHAHIFQAENRRQGLGSQVFFEVVRRAFTTFHLKKINCDPTASNPAPNKLLQKMGLQPLRTIETPAEGILRQRIANHYEITKDLVEKWCHLKT